MTGFAHRGLPKILGFHTFMTVDDGGSVTSIHQVPDEPFVHACDAAGTCMCGPQVVFSVVNGRELPMMRHAALDGAYHEYPDLDDLDEVDMDDIIFDEDDD